MALGSALDASATGSERVPGTRAEWNKRSRHVELANYSKWNQTGKSLELQTEHCLFAHMARHYGFNVHNSL
jgi:hypothetical protein